MAAVAVIEYCVLGDNPVNLQYLLVVVAVMAEPLVGTAVMEYEEYERSMMSTGIFCQELELLSVSEMIELDCTAL